MSQATTQIEVPYHKGAFGKNLYILRSLVSKDFTRKYRRSVLGIVWSVLNPLLMMCVLTAVFSFMFRFKIEHYPLYLILGNILFTMNSRATSDAMTSIISSASMIKKIKVEKVIFPLEKVIFEVVNFCFSLVAVVIVMVFMQVMPTWRLVFLPVLVLMVMLFSSGVGMLLASLAVFFRDVVHIWSVVITAWMYATPLFYPFDLLPGIMQTVMLFNPMYQFVTYFRDIVMWGVTPSLTMHGICFGMAIATFLVGLLVFRLTENKFILYV